MRNFIFLLFLLFIGSNAIFAQEQTAQTLESFSISTITDAFKLLISSVNWLFVIVFMFLTWLLNDTSEATNTVTWLNWFSKIPKAFRALGIGIIWLFIFTWVYRITGRAEVFKLFLSLLCAMVIYKFGIDKILRYISQRMGLKFE